MEKKKVNITNSNSYTFIFAIILVVVVGSVLAFAATTLQPLQNENVRKEKMQNILATVGVETDRDGAEALYNNYVKEAYVLDQNGDVIESEDAFAIDLKKELRKSVEKQFFPIYIAEIEGENYYIVPLQGKGLWDDIWGYIALKNDVNTIQGAVFDHKGETPGLGAEITQGWFQERFTDEKIFDSNGNLVGVAVVKGRPDPTDKGDNKVDAISGATITGDGVSNMIAERLQHYLPYLKKQEGFKVANQ
jgi:Na+-transporting NADH:ubiquinone oxidoreductase subunit C